MILNARALRGPPGGLGGRAVPARRVWGAASPPRAGGLGGIVPPRQQRRGRDTRTAADIAAATNRPLRRPVRRAGGWHGGFRNQGAVRRRGPARDRIAGRRL